MPRDQGSSWKVQGGYQAPGGRKPTAPITGSGVLERSARSRFVYAKARRTIAENRRTRMDRHQRTVFVLWALTAAAMARFSS